MMTTEETPLLLLPLDTATKGLSTTPSGGGTEGGEIEEDIKRKDEDTTRSSPFLSKGPKVNDEYIISLIRRTATVTTTTGNENDDNDGFFGSHVGENYVRNDSLLADDDNNNNNNNDDNNDRVGVGEDDDGGDGGGGGTTFGQTVIHLVKGYIGCGILSLPWAVSQLGIPLGLLAIVSMSLWSSYNCWTVVKIKQYIERTTINNNNNKDDDDDDDDDDSGSDDDSETSRISRRTTDASSVASSNITYPDVGEWAHGIEFQKYISICICAQQLAICTVFVSFVSENLYASLKFFDVPIQHLNHMSVGAMIMPVILGLSCGLPSVQSMAPFMLCAFLLMLSGFASLGFIGYLKWDDRPTASADEELLPTFTFDKNAPMALCGILYSFEGICIVLPVENSMIKYDTPIRGRTYFQQFKYAFIMSIIIVTFLLCLMAGMGVYVFGNVSNGSITAFLLDEYKDSPEIQFWVMLSNVLVTVSIVFSYPLMLFPAVELLAPAFKDWKAKIRRKQCYFWNSINQAQHNQESKNNHNNGNNRNDDDISRMDDDDDDDRSGFFSCNNSEDGDDNNNNEHGNNNNNNNNNDDNDGEEQKLEGFDRMVVISEHSVASMRSLTSLPESMYHDYDNNIDNDNNGSNSNSNKNKDADGIKSTAAAVVAASNVDNETTDTGEAIDGDGHGGSASLSHLSSVTSYQRRSGVEGEDNDHDDDDDDDDNHNNNKRSNNNQHDESAAASKWQLPGDSPLFRAVIVMGTYLIAMMVPNVQSLVAVVGAVTGSSTALLIPPILELAWIKHMETLHEKRVRKQPHLGEWEGGPSKALRRTLFGSSQNNVPHRKRERSGNNKTNRRKRNKYLFDKIVSWCLLVLGTIFALIGSYFSVRDIIESYGE